MRALPLGHHLCLPPHLTRRSVCVDQAGALTPSRLQLSAGYVEVEKTPHPENTVRGPGLL